MKEWLLLPFATKALDLLLILAAIIIAGGFLLFFIKMLREITKGSVKVGPVAIGGEEGDEASQKVNVFINTDEKHKETEVAGSYHAPKGVLPFTQHRYFKMMEDAMHGKSLELKSRHPKSAYSHLKNAAFTHFLLQCKAKVFYDMIEDYVDDVLETGGDYSVLSSIKKRTERAIKSYEEKARSSHVQVSETEYLIHIPELMITKFNDWHQPHVDLTVERLDHILQSQFYPSWQLKLISILDTFEIIFGVTFNYAEYSLMDLNGDLDAALLSELAEKKACLER